LYADDGQFTASASFSTARGKLVDTFIDKLKGAVKPLLNCDMFCCQIRVCGGDVNEKAMGEGGDLNISSPCEGRGTIHKDGGGVVAKSHN